MLLEQLTIPRRFNGPPESANGGWTAGLLAASLLRHNRADRAGNVPVGLLPAMVQHGGIAVSLRAPPPLDCVLQVFANPDGSATLQDGELILAQAQCEDFVLTLPSMPSLSAARQAGRSGFERSQWRASWPYARCFGCGVARDDGLCITPGPLASAGHEGLIAAVWTPPVWLAQGEGLIRMEAVWAALDCPAGIAWSYQLPEGAPMVTARIVLSIEALPQAGQPCLVLGWPISRDGRKLHAGSALLDEQGRVLARSRQLWLLPRETV